MDAYTKFIMALYDAAFEGDKMWSAGNIHWCTLLSEYLGSYNAIGLAATSPDPDTMEGLGATARFNTDLNHDWITHYHKESLGFINKDWSPPDQVKRYRYTKDEVERSGYSPWLEQSGLAMDMGMIANFSVSVDKNSHISEGIPTGIAVYPTKRHTITEEQVQKLQKVLPIIKQATEISFRNIIAKKQASHNEQLLYLSLMPTAHLDKNGVIVWANKSFEEILLGHTVLSSANGKLHALHSSNEQISKLIRQVLCFQTKKLFC